MSGRKALEVALPDWAPKLGLQEAAAILGMSFHSLYKLLEDSTVAEADKPPYYRRPGGHYRFCEAELQRCLSRYARGNRGRDASTRNLT
jgi:hypothetical protein